MNTIEEAKIKLTKYNQRKILKIIEKLDEKNQIKLANEILETNFEQILDLYRNREKKDEILEGIEPIEAIDKNNIQTQYLAKLGEEVIKQNQYAVVTLAGGQGTRLGFNGPKGAFKLDIDKNGKYIFEILIDKLKKAKQDYGVEINWYLMTSISNNEQTIKFFEEHNYFGYNREKIKFFKQKSIPVIDEQGNLLIDKDFNIKKSSDGNGSVFKSLKATGMIDDMEQNGIKWIYICNVDNILVNMVDSVFLGLVIDKNARSASKSMKKSTPDEKVGIFCKKNGKPAIIEYMDMTQEMIYAKKDNGELLYNESSIGNYLLNIEEIKKISLHDLRYHSAFKKSSYIDENLQEIIPEKPNTYKFEKFIFDGFEYLDNMVIMSVNRNEEFAPVKNATGVDSPETAIKLYIKNPN